MKTTSTPKHRCPYCGRKMSAATNFTKSVSPKPGDPSICIGCAEVLIFDANLRSVKPTPAQLIDLQTNPVWRGIETHQRAVRAMHHEDAPKIEFEGPEGEA